MESPSPGFTFRSADSADMDYALDCFVRAFHEEWELEGVMPTETDSALRERVRHLLRPTRKGVMSRFLERTKEVPRETIVALDDHGRRVGCLVLAIRSDLEPGTAWIDLVFVEPDQRQRGVGKAIMTRADEWARDKGATSVMLGVRSNNLIAIHLYESAGYTARSFWMRKKI